MIIIDHEKYGIRAEFESIDEAESSILACFPGDLPTTLRVNLDREVLNEADEIVGEFIE